MSDNVTELSGSEPLTQMGIVAERWAEQFKCLVPGAEHVDEYDLIAWFANAIGAGESHGFTRGCLASDTIRDLIRGTGATRTAN